jgi:hypothetical protein
MLDDDRKRSRDAGAIRVIVYSQKMRHEDAEGKGLEVVKGLASIVERAAGVRGGERKRAPSKRSDIPGELRRR